MRRYTLIFLTAFASCNRHEANFKKILSSNAGKLWIMTFPHEKKPHRAYKFFSNGRCNYYVFSNSGALSLYNWGDDIVSNSWRREGDSLTINGTSIYMINYSEKKIILSYEKDTITLQPASDR